MKNILFGIFLTFSCSLMSCGSYDDEYIEVNQFPKYSWTAAADSASTTFVNRYWNTSVGCFNNTFDGQIAQNDYWPEAHGLDVVVDAYLRTHDEKYKKVIWDFYDGVKNKNGGKWRHDFYDDMGWHAMAHLRAYYATNDDRFLKSSHELWTWITEGWNDYDGGGIQWKVGTDAESMGKGIPSNGPAAIIAARFAQKYPDETINGFTNLQWSLRIYEWMKYHRTVLSTGRIFENYDTTNGDYSYDVGTFMGAAIELYNITKEKVYFNDAVKVARYHIANNVNTAYKVMRDYGEQTGDGGGHDCNLFKGIFVRYFTILIQHPDLSDGDRMRFVAFLKNNANYLWTLGTEKPDIKMSPTWWQMPKGDTSWGDLRSAISGTTTIEAMALLEKNGFVD